MQHESIHDPDVDRGPMAHRPPGILRPGYVPIDGAAQYASVSTKTIQRWIKGGLPVYQGTARGKVLIRPSDIDVYLTRRQARQIDLNAMVNDVLWGIQGSA